MKNQTTKERIEKIINQRVEYTYIQDGGESYIIGSPSELADAFIQAGVCFKDEVGIDATSVVSFLDEKFSGCLGCRQADTGDVLDNVSEAISAHAKDLLTFKEK